jgi:transcriptional regulator with XRE-family HTH domain
MTRATSNPFALLLRRALSRRGYTQARLAREIGLSPRAIGQWLRGDSVPTLAHVKLAADLLAFPSLADAAVKTLRHDCAICGRSFLTHGRRRRVCGDNCATVLRTRRLRQRRVMFDRAVGNRLREHSEAVFAFCRACEPEGLCRTASCELRPVSPLPLLIQVERRRIA